MDWDFKINILLVRIYRIRIIVIYVVLYLKFEV